MSKRDEYVEKLKAQLDTWNAEIDKLEAKARESTADLKSAAKTSVAAFRRQCDQARQKLTQIQAASENSWKELKQGAEEAWARLKEAFVKARSEIKKLP